MSEAKHTPTPWKAKERQYSIVALGKGDIEIMSTSWHGSIRSRYPLKDESLANMHFVIEAVNNYESLRAQLAIARKALEGMIDMYVALVESGDAGFWDPEKVEEVIAARSALKETA